ncbi:DUF2461 domain-containing protein [Fulvivirgaceae bacterium BMA10]|uniref:DUF2461 domain-containing protein n=1 Tax=Splendidivirga corallicola TaxID=3051826 RepID=A0ABT8KQ26_9BACT|nr:DUF2461 domain-containing protein [Fulvivirgaceae bacterium BMA10]
MLHLTKDFINFFQGLEKNNNKEWFDVNRKTYEKAVKEPLKNIVDALIVKVQELDPSIQITSKDALFRINRDIRFSKDKTPYNVHISANIAKGGKKSHHSGFYLMVKADKLMIGGGAYMLDKDQLKKIRTEISYCMEEFNDLLNDKEFKKLFGTIQGEQNKVIPKEFKEDAEKQPLLANKQFYYMTEYVGAKDILREDLVDFVFNHYKVGHKVNAFMDRAMELG